MEGGSDDFLALYFLEQFPQASEAESRELLVVGEWGHGHEANDFEVGQGADLLGERGDGTDGEAELLFFLAGVDLEEDFDTVGQSQSGGGSVDFLGESERVDGMDAVDQGQEGFDLVALEVANHVPAGPGGRFLLDAGQPIAAAADEFVDHGLTLGKLLDLRFTEIGQSHFEQQPDGVDLDGFGNGDKADVGGVAMGAGAGFGDVVLDTFEVFGDFLFHVCLFGVRRSGCHWWVCPMRMLLTSWLLMGRMIRARAPKSKAGVGF